MKPKTTEDWGLFLDMIDHFFWWMKWAKRTQIDTTLRYLEKLKAESEQETTNEL